MDVPFISSGAMSRAHYALVRRVETAPSSSTSDQLLLAELQGIHRRLTHSALTLKQLKECLILLLYCSMTLSKDTSVNVDFALPHAVNLAEAGQTAQDKRIGYLYCAEMMPKDHELQLMLINTLRKDLESSSTPHICLALEALVQSPSEDVIPAVQERLQDLLSHNSPHVRRRALLALRALSIAHRDILQYIGTDKLQHLLRESDATVASAALLIASNLIEVGSLSTEELRDSLHRLLRRASQSHGDKSQYWLLIKVIEVLRVIRPSFEDAKLLLDILKFRSRFGPSENVIIHQCFLALSVTDGPVLLEAQSSAGTTFVESIRPLLISSKVNDIYIFISCLSCLEPRLWAGTTPEVPAVLQGWEVERVMKLLDSPDSAIRQRTLTVLLKVDRTIVDSYYTQFMKIGLALSAPDEQEEASRRLLQVVAVLHSQDGESYAHGLKNLIFSLNTSTGGKDRILQGVVEDTLTFLRAAQVEFRSGFLGVIFALLMEPDGTLRPTLLVILSALACEYLESSPVPPSVMLQGFASQLSVHGPAIQDVCLLSMIRIAEPCDAIPEQVVGVVRKVQEQAGRHIMTRCDQFISLSQSRTIIQYIVCKAKTSSLPDFLVALEAYEREKSTHATRSPPLNPASFPDRPASQASSHASQTPGKLRYTAYDAPKATPRLRRPSSSSSYSAAHSDGGRSRFIGQGRDFEDPLSRTITAGDLTLASEHIELQQLAKSPKKSMMLPAIVDLVDENNSDSRVDLIALDSPFISEPASGIPTVADLDFEVTWSKLSQANLRGWCESPIEAIVRQLQGMQHKIRVISADQPPFKGDLKMTVSSDTTGIAVLRLREGDDESCLWHLRCEDEALGASIKALLTDI